MVAACGSDSDSGGSPTTTTASSSTTTATSGGNDGGSTTAAPSSSVSEDNIDRSAHANVTYWGSPASLDPHMEQNGGQRVYWRVAYDTLFEENPAGGGIPGLAASFDRSDDGLEYTLHLRTDVQFADGTPVDAAAAKASLDRVKADGVPGVAGLLNAVESVTVTDGETVVIKLTEPTPELPAILSGPAGAVINPKALADPEALISQTAGSGPYQSTKFVPETEVSYERSSVEYWQPDAGRLGSLTITFVSDVQTAVNGLLAGQFDAMHTVGQLEQIKQAEAANKGIIYDYASTSSEVVFLSATRGVLADQRVRQAMAFAVDRDGIAEGVYQGDCASTSQPFLEGSALHVPTEPYNYDPDKARELIKEAGAEGASIELVNQATSVHNAASAALQQMWEAIGLDVTIRPEPSASAAFTGFAGGEQDTFMAGFGRQADPMLAVSRYYLAGGVFGLAADDTELQDLVDQVRDPATPAADLAGLNLQIAERVSAGAYALLTCTPTNHITAQPNVVGLDGMRNQA
ncbi:MAG TPA: ABC transporter substrate-binding protein, partial [Ilumatobacteraceae bacterium]|nr:ABC transporter substrate-binding protein [Ilumatobacteraceae bacterium]